MSKVDRAAILGSMTKAIAKMMVVAIATIALFFTSDIVNPQAANAYPFWAQETAP
ncbi:MAG: apocytochrome f, partial [Okeania sp. SIO2D1]|nr:apocytochrome f [Okeania sp. SIO2D1]